MRGFSDRLFVSSHRGGGGLDRGMDGEGGGLGNSGLGATAGGGCGGGAVVGGGVNSGGVFNL